MKKFEILLLFLFLNFLPIFLVDAQNLPEIFNSNPFSIPGRIEGKGTNFEIKNSEYLNVKLESSEEIEVILESIPRMISININSSTASSTQLTLSGLEPNKTYYKYEDSYKNGISFVSDEKGSFSWQQDLTKPHHVWIQEEKGTTYIDKDTVLDQDIAGSVEIVADNITLDCQGHKIMGDGSSHGIYLSNRKNVVIKNCEISNFTYGIYLWESSLNNLNNNKINSNGMAGIDVCGLWNKGSADNNLITNNTIESNKNGISLEGSSNNTLNNNVILNNSVHGILLYVSSNNNLIQNEIKFNEGGITFIFAQNNTLTENIINGNKLYGIYFYYEGTSNNNLSGNKISENKYNLWIAVQPGYDASEFIQSIDQTNTINGKPVYYLVNERDKEISGEAGFVGIVNSTNITIKNLTLANNYQGILFAFTNNSKIEGISVSENMFGIFLYESSNNSFIKNKFSNNEESGIYFSYSSNNVFIENEIKSNKYGIYVFYSTDNKFYHNNFLNNSIQVYNYLKWNNIYDNGYPSGGNYWSDYGGKDEKSGPNQDQPGSDGIGDAPYYAYGGYDRYPFMKENGWIKPKVLISEVYYDVAKDKGEEEWNEWVIIHNLEKESVNLSDWKICSRDKNQERCNKLSGEILAGGFAIITPTSTTFDFWKIPKDMTKIVLGKKFGSYGLNNNGDNLILRNEKGEMVDAMSYGTDTSIFDPSCIDVKEGYSLLRFPPDQDTDTAQDFKESEPTIKNKLPIPIIKFSPKNPVKGIEVKFDASSSTDPDGKIISFFWDFGDGESTTTNTSTISHIFSEFGTYTVILTVEDDSGATSSTSTQIQISPWSFVIITDLHIGWGIPDYDSEGFDESTEYLLKGRLDTQDYYITQRLQQAVEWINENYEQKNIKFVVVLGDISDTAEYSEFIKAREILNELEIPYIPLIGNHDIWPYTQKITADPDNRLFSMREKANSPSGELYFEIVFWEQNATNTRKIKELFDFFERQEDLPEYQGSPYLQNYVFSFGGVNFIALDFATRNYFKLIKTPFNETLHSETFDWFKEKLQNCQKNPGIILAHYPFVGLRTGFSPFDLKQIDQYIENSQCKLINLGGHTHRNEITSKDYYQVVETEPISQIKLSYDLTGHPIRIIKIEADELIKYQILEGDFSPSLNPFITANKEKTTVGKPIKFYANAKNVNIEDLSPFEWEFEGNPNIICYSTRGNLNNVCEVTYNTEGNYEVKLKATLRENPNHFEEISVNIKVEREPKSWWKIFLPFDNFKAFLNDLTQVDLTKDENTQYSSEWVTIGKVSSPLIPIGSFVVNHEKAIGQVDLSKARFDIDIQTFKALFHIPEENQEIERSKILYLPF